jgi:small subunit ribosomal protein S6
MKKYELLYIIPTQYTDTEVEEIMVKMSTLVEGEGAKVSRNENLGKIKLAYPINKVRHGTYILAHFEAEPSIISELDRRLKLAEEVLRHQILIMPAGAEDREYEISSYVAPLSEEARAQKSAPKAKPAEKKLAPPTPATEEEAKEATKMSMAELDKKLDEILESEKENI